MLPFCLYLIFTCPEGHQTFFYCSVFNFTQLLWVLPKFVTFVYSQNFNNVAVSTVSVQYNSGKNMHCILFWYECLDAIFIWYIHNIVLQYNSLYTVCTIQLQPVKLFKNKLTIFTEFYTFEYVTWLMKPKHIYKKYFDGSVFNGSPQCLIDAQHDFECSVSFCKRFVEFWQNGYFQFWGGSKYCIDTIVSA